MSDLYTVNKSPFSKGSLDTALAYSKAGTAILLYEDGVYAVVKGSAAEAKIKEAMGDKKVYALGPDVAARGIAEDRVIDGIELIDYAGFVDLVEATDKVQAWL